jgi:polyisoprenyl-phosphate glycosyltransferase
MPAMMKKQMLRGLSVVIPCYNEQACLGELYRRVTAACASVSGDYEIVLVNDGSKDQTWALIQSLIAVDKHVVGVNLGRNHGHQLALTAGLSVCRGEKIFVIDADLQDPPELLIPMLAEMDSQKADVVYGQRTSRKGESWFKRASAAAFYRFLNRLSEVTIPVDTGDFRLMTRRVLDIFLSMPEQHRFIRGMIAWIGFKQVPFRYDRDARFAGESNYPLSKMLKLTVDALTGFSVVPLRFAVRLGVYFGLAGIALLGYTFFSWIGGQAVAGWTSLMCVVLIMGSVQLLVLGVLGEYLGRLYMQSKGRPMFIIETVLRNEEIFAAEMIPRIPVAVQG